MGSDRRRNEVGKPNDRSALEHIYLKPWRKSFVTKEFLTTFVHKPGQDSPDEGLREHDEDKDKGSIYHLDGPSYWVKDEILEDDTQDESSSSDSDETFLSEDEEKSIDEFAIAYADELQLPSNVSVLKPQTQGVQLTTIPAKSNNTLTMSKMILKLPSNVSVLKSQTQGVDLATNPIKPNNTPTMSKMILKLPSNVSVLKPQTRGVNPATNPVKSNNTPTMGNRILEKELNNLVLKAEEYSCPDCLKVFPRKANFEKHKILMHDKSRLFVCDVCEKRFTNGKNLKSHKYKVHGAGQFKKKMRKAEEKHKTAN